MNLPWHERERIFQVVKGIFQNALGPVLLDCAYRKLLFVNSTVYESTSSSKISEVVFSKDFPEVRGECDLDHYTSFDALKGIVGTGTVLLASVKKRISEGEFGTFVSEHDLAGYDQVGASGRPIYEELAGDLFYLSLTRPGNPNERNLWDLFGDCGYGVRIRFRLTPSAAVDLREIGYRRADTPTTLKTIANALRKEGLAFTAWKTSRMCAFYLPIGFEDEREVRLARLIHERP